MKEYYDNEKSSNHFFPVGDLVMIPNNYQLQANGKSKKKKLHPKFRGQFKISAVLHNDRYEVSSIDRH